MKSWKEMWEDVENSEAPPSVPGKLRASKAPKYAYCTEFEQTGPSNVFAVRGNVLHDCMELEDVPFDIPPEEEQQIQIAKEALDSFLEEGWEVVGREVFLETNLTTCNADIILKRDDEYCYIDWKFGMAPVDSDSPQMAVGADAVYQHYAASKVMTAIIQPSMIESTGSLAIKNWTREEAFSVVEDCIKEKVGASKNCQYCDKSGDCPFVFEKGTNILSLIHI